MEKAGRRANSNSSVGMNSTATRSAKIIQPQPVHQSVSTAFFVLNHHVVLRAIVIVSLIIMSIAIAIAMVISTTITVFDDGFR